MDILKEHILTTLKDLREDDFREFKWRLQHPVNVEGLQLLQTCDLENADRMKTVDLIVQTYTTNATQIVANILKKIRTDLQEKFLNRPKDCSDVPETSGSSSASYQRPNDDVSDVGESSGSSLLTASSQPPQKDLLVDTQEHVKQRVSFYQNGLKKLVVKPFTSVPEGTFKMEEKKLFKECYTYVSIIQVENTEVSSEHEVTQMEMKKAGQEIQLSQIFKSPSGENIRTVMSIGIAGVGKSFLVQKFVSDWAKKENELPHLTFVFQFRHLNLLEGRKFTLSQLIRECITTTKFIPEEALNYIFTTLQKSGITDYDNSPVKLLFVLDGLDESKLKLHFNTKYVCSDDFSQSTLLEVLLVNLMEGKLLRCAHIWITTRPAAAKNIPSNFVDLVTEVTGFSDDKKKEYIMKRFSDENQANRIISHINETRTLHIMCEIPVFCSITGTVLQNMLMTDQTVELPKTQTEMYCRFLMPLVQTKSDGEKYETQADLLKLARLAFEHLETGKLIFYQTDLEKCGLGVKEAPQYSALGTEIFKKDSDCSKEEPIYCFAHLSIQEFLAAVYLFHCFTERKINVLHTFLAGWKIFLKPKSLDYFLKKTMLKALKSENGHLDLFVRFLHGLSLESNQRLLKGLLSQAENSPENVQKVIQNLKEMNTDASPDRCINIFHCLMEMKDQSVYQDIQTYMKSENKRGGGLSEIQCSALAYMLQMSEEVLDELKLSTFNTSLEGRRRLIPALRNYIKAELGGCGLTERCCDDLASVLSSNSSSLTILDLSYNALHDAGAKRLCVGLKSPHCKLEELWLSTCGLTERCCDDLASVLSSNSSSLTILNLDRNALHDAGAKRLCVGLKSPHCKLKELWLYLCGLTERCCDDLASVLSSNSSSLTILNLYGNALHDAGAKRLCVGLKSPHCKLKELWLRSCGLTEICCDDLASVLSSNSSSLTILYLDGNMLRDAGAKRLCVGLKSPHCKLKLLRLEGNNLTRECREELSVLSSNTSCEIIF